MVVVAVVCVGRGVKGVQLVVLTQRAANMCVDGGCGENRKNASENYLCGEVSSAHSRVH